MVYRNSSIPLATRIRCAIAAFPFELPKLAVTAVISEQNFAEALERRLQNMERIMMEMGVYLKLRPCRRLRRNLQNHTSMIDVSAGYDRENRFALLISIEAKHKKSNG
jgi:hypothetical protein